MGSAPNKFFVPTLEIDLAWQYVGVSAPRFAEKSLPTSVVPISSTRKDTLLIASSSQRGSLTSLYLLTVARVRNSGNSFSDDNVEETQLSNSFNDTRDAWEVRLASHLGFVT